MEDDSSFPLMENYSIPSWPLTAMLNRVKSLAW